MPAIPVPGVDTDWGTKLNAHLAVLLEPTTGFLKGGITQVYSGSGTPLTIQDGSSANNTIIIQPTVNKSNSTSVGGALYIQNSGSVGAGLVIYSTQAAPTGRLLVVRANNATFAQTAAYIQHHGTGRAMHVDADGTGIGLEVNGSGGATEGSMHALAVSLSGTGSGSSCAASFASVNRAHSCVQITGFETGRGSLKIAHVYPGESDANASALSIDINGDGTAAKGIYVTSTATGGTTGTLIDLRNGSALFRFQVHGSGEIINHVLGSDPGDTKLWPNSMLYYLNEAGNTLIFKVKYAGGTVKTGSIALT